MFNFKNSNIQGNAGLGAAIGYFTMMGYSISIPLTDTQEYDLLIDNGVSILKVQVKTSRFIRNNKYAVHLRTSGGNKSRTTKKDFDATKTDILFILTSDNNMYCIPTKEIKSVTAIALGEYYHKYNVTFTPKKHEPVERHPNKPPKQRVKKALQKVKCDRCPNLVSKRTKYSLCSTCQSINQRKVDRPSLDTLLEQVQELGFSAVGRLYGVSDNAIRKWIKSYKSNKGGI